MADDECRVCNQAMRPQYLGSMALIILVFSLSYGRCCSGENVSLRVEGDFKMELTVAGETWFKQFPKAFLLNNSNKTIYA